MLTHHQHRARQFGQQLFVADVEFLRLAQFDDGGYRIAGFEQCLAQQEARRARLGILLQRRLELDDGRLGILLLE